MSYDWNWFFSSFCQSAAALIGIIAAFIISRLLSLGEKINATVSNFDNLVIESEKLKKSLLNRNFYWFNKKTVRYSTNLKDAIKKGEYENLSQEEIIHKIYESDTDLYKVDEAVMESFNELYNLHKPRRNSTFAPLSDIDMLMSTALASDLHEEKEAIKSLEVECNTLIKYFEQNSQTLNAFLGTIKPLKIIIILLMIAFPLTVIYPLHFMPVLTNVDFSPSFNLAFILKSLFTFKSLMLLIFLLIIELIFSYFFLLNKELEKTLINAIKTNSDSFKNIKYYSEYFHNN